MKLGKPFNLQTWIEENRALLKPPVGNQTIYQGNDDFMVMIVGGPNARVDYHINKGEELFYQIEGEIEIKTITPEGKPESIFLKAGDMMLLPAGIPHSPRRPANSVGLVIERYRNQTEEDGFVWFCEQCGHKLYERYLPVKDIVRDLPPVLNSFRERVELRTCQECGKVN